MARHTEHLFGQGGGQVEISRRGRAGAVGDRTFPLDGIVEAHRYVDAGHKGGGVVITIPPDDTLRR